MICLQWLARTRSAGPVMVPASRGPTGETEVTIFEEPWILLMEIWGRQMIL